MSLSPLNANVQGFVETDLLGIPYFSFVLTCLDVVVVEIGSHDDPSRLA